jgi:hypothetical protein
VWRLLSWDTEFFGFAIGEIEVEGLDGPTIAKAEDDARYEGVRCLYAEADGNAVGSIDMLQRLGYRLMEVAVELEHRANVDPPPTRARVRRGTVDDVPDLDALLELVAPWSRFAVDPRFGLDAARAMHRAWLERAATQADGRSLLLAEHDGRITGVLTTSWADDPSGSDGRRPRIDLIASNEPRSGAAPAMVAHAIASFGPTPSLAGPIAARNVASLRFSENMGYRVTRAEYRYHRWLDEDAGISSPT